MKEKESPNNHFDQELALRIGQAVVAECRRLLTVHYEEAGLSGLCGEGRWEVALGSLETLDLQKIIDSAIKRESKS